MDSLTNDLHQHALDPLTDVEPIDLGQYAQAEMVIGVELGPDVLALKRHLTSLLAEIGGQRLNAPDSGVACLASGNAANSFCRHSGMGRN